MVNRTQFYIDGAWIEPAVMRTVSVTNPATAEDMYQIAIGSKADVDRAARAGRLAFNEFSQTTREQRIKVLARIVEIYKGRVNEIGESISDEIGAPIGMAVQMQANSALGHFAAMLEILKTYSFEQRIGDAIVLREPVGVVGMITPWNWPMAQIACKVAPALAAGCTMILKPSEFAPTCALIFAEILHEAGVPKGVFNLINGLGPEVGVAMSEHPDLDMISFTGSTRAGIDVASRAATTVKRVSQELGGKSPYIVLDDADLGKALRNCINTVYLNSGQSCDAPTRLIVPQSKMTEVTKIAKEIAHSFKVGNPRGEATSMGPVVNRSQWEKVQSLIQRGIDEGATLIAGGLGLPQGIDRGYYVQPTIFANATNDMTIAREEIFGPVLVIIGAEDESDAIRIANDTPYGLAGYIFSGSNNRARRVATMIRAGNIYLQGAPLDRTAPFGGYKQSGNGREWGRFGLEEYFEIKAIAGFT